MHDEFSGHLGMAEWPLDGPGGHRWPRQRLADGFSVSLVVDGGGGSGHSGHSLMAEWPMTFREYIAGRQCRDNPQGDFVEDARRDPRFPDVQSWPDLKHYLAMRSACEEVLAAARVVWQGYRTALQRQAGG